MPEARAREIATTPPAREKIPADVLYFDIDYQQGNAPFTVNREYFPHFEQNDRGLPQARLSHGFSSPTCTSKITRATAMRRTTPESR